MKVTKKKRKEINEQRMRRLNDPSRKKSESIQNHINDVLDRKLAWLLEQDYIHLTQLPTIPPWAHEAETRQLVDYTNIFINPSLNTEQKRYVDECLKRWDRLRLFIVNRLQEDNLG